MKQLINILLFLLITLISGETFQKTYTFIGDSRGCSSCTIGSYVNHWHCANSFMKNFSNPLPPGYLLSSIEMNVTGAFHIYFDQRTILKIFLQKEEILNKEMPTVHTTFCHNCHSSILIPSHDWGLTGWPNFEYNGTNTFQIIVTTLNNICLSEVKVTFKAVNILPNVTRLSPPLIPRGVSNKIEVLGSNFLPPETGIYYRCFYKLFPNDFILAQYIDGNTLSCNIPTVANQTITPFQIEISNRFIVVPTNHSVVDIFFYDPPTITKAEPNMADVNGEDDIYVFGNGFFKSEYMKCKFGSVVVKAVFINSTCVRCTTPENPIGQILLSVSENGINYGPEIVFNFVEVAPFEPIIPKADPLLQYKYLLIGGLCLLVITLASVIFAIYKRKQNSRYSPIADDSGRIDFRDLKTKERIGRGSFGDVYRAYYHGTEVAVKRLPNYKLTPNFIRELFEEALLMRKIRHPNILTFMGFCADKPDICIVTEYMSWGSLYDVLHNPAIKIDNYHIRQFCVDTTKGMAYLHNVSFIIHRDLKSHNLLVDQNWNIKVSDFGLSKTIEDHFTNKTLTACGTPCWTAPEVLRNEKYSFSCDVYSFGICLWEMCTRLDPFPGKAPFQIVIDVGSKGSRLDIPDTCLQFFKQVMEGCWNEDPNGRPSFERLVQEFENEHIQMTSQFPEIDPSFPSKKKKQ